jgi:hypothetical protein
MAISFPETEVRPFETLDIIDDGKVSMVYVPVNPIVSCWVNGIKGMK